MFEKLRAVEQLAKLCGFNEPEKMEMEHGTRRSRHSLKSSLDCAGVERHTTTSVPDKLAR
jgi:hypothetical protein